MARTIVRHCSGGHFCWIQRIVKKDRLCIGREYLVTGHQKFGLLDMVEQFLRLYISNTSKTRSVFTCVACNYYGFVGIWDLDC